MKTKFFIPFVIIISFIISSISIAQWTVQGTITGIDTWPSISVYSPSGVVAAGGPSGVPKVFKSTNSGVNWTDISGNLTGPELYCVWAVDGNVIYVGDGGVNGGSGGNAKIWKTTNGGTNWTVMISTGGVAGFFNGIVFSRTNPLIGIAHSDPPTTGGLPFVLKTTNGGNNWFNQTAITSSTGVAGSVFCIDSMLYGWGSSGTATPRFVLTTDGGVTWNIKDIGFTANDYVSGVAFRSDRLIGIAAGSSLLPNISRSVNGGANWTVTNTLLPVTSVDFTRMKWVYGTNVCYLTSQVGASGCVGKSTNSGANWSVMSTSGVTNMFNFDLINVSGVVYAYAITATGIVIRLQETVSGIQFLGTGVPSNYILNQNYPNPFNPTTKISFSLFKSGFTTLKVYDMLGEEVATLVNENLKAGSYGVDFNCAGLSGGVYFYKLVSGSFSGTKKLIYLK